MTHHHPFSFSFFGSCGVFFSLLFFFLSFSTLQIKQNKHSLLKLHSFIILSALFPPCFTLHLLFNHFQHYEGSQELESFLKASFIVIQFGEKQISFRDCKF